MNAITTRSASVSLAPTNMPEAMQFADMLAKSDMVPKDFKGRPANVLVAIQWGYEVGLGPLQALQNIAVINGRPSIWGDAALALVRGHPACEAVREGVEGEGEARQGFCEVKRRGQPAERRTFSVADARKAGLWGKSGPWQQYPDRMLQLRARGFAIRDVFPDALRGVITREEAQDMPPEPEEPREVPNLAPAPAPAPAQKPAVVDEAEFPIIAPDGRVFGVRRAKWMPSVERALSKLESLGAVSGWRAEMGPLLASMHDAGEADLVAEAEAAIEARKTELAISAEGVE